MADGREGKEERTARQPRKRTSKRMQPAGGSTAKTPREPVSDGGTDNTKRDPLEAFEIAGFVPPSPTITVVPVEPGKPARESLPEPSQPLAAAAGPATAAAEHQVAGIAGAVATPAVNAGPLGSSSTERATGAASGSAAALLPSSAAADRPQQGGMGAAGLVAVQLATPGVSPLEIPPHAPQPVAAQVTGGAPSPAPHTSIGSAAVVPGTTSAAGPRTHAATVHPGPDAAQASGGSGVSGTAEPRYPLRGVVVGRRRQHRLNLELVNGSLFDVEVRALVLGLFQNVTPTGPAARLDSLLGGAITNFAQRRLFSASLGELFILPTGTHLVRAEFIVFVGLGAYDQFASKPVQETDRRWTMAGGDATGPSWSGNAEPPAPGSGGPGNQMAAVHGPTRLGSTMPGSIPPSVESFLALRSGSTAFDPLPGRRPVVVNNPQSLVASNVLRYLLRAGIDEFATLLFGSGSGIDSSESLQNVVTGFVSGLLEADQRHRFRRIVLCERDPERYDQMKDELYRLARTPLFDELEVTIDEERYPPLRLEREFLVSEGAAERGVREAEVWPENVLYLTIRAIPRANDEQLEFEITALTAGEKATVLSESQTCSRQELDRLLEEPLRGHLFDPQDFGRRLSQLVVNESIREIARQQWADFDQIPDEADRLRRKPHLILVHDFEASRIPWEAIPIGDAPPALVSGITRRYMAQNLSIAKWLETRRMDATLDILLVINPTEDLPGAEREGERLHATLAKLPLVKLRVIQGREATKATLLKEFASGAYDVIHYAGHASFNRDERQRSGLVAAGGEIVSGEDLIGLANLPALVFFNACNSGRMRDGLAEPAEVDRTLKLKGRIDHSLQAHTSFAEAFLRGGVANFVGTLWPVEDEAADKFASVFYQELLVGQSIGQAVLKSRQALVRLPSKDWANYIVYGSPSFRVKMRDGQIRM